MYKSAFFFILVRDGNLVAWQFHYKHATARLARHSSSLRERDFIFSCHQVQVEANRGVADPYVLATRFTTTDQLHKVIFSVND